MYDKLVREIPGLTDPAKRATLSPATIAALGNEAGMRFGEKTAANLTPELLDWLAEIARKRGGGAGSITTQVRRLEDGGNGRSCGIGHKCE